MTSNVRRQGRILGSLRSIDGKGAVLMQDRFETDADDLWAALTEPARLGRWLGEVTGDLHVGGRFTARFFASDWEGSGRVVACEAPRRFLITTVGAGEDEEQTIGVRLNVDGEQTVLLIEERGLPLDQLAEYGAGLQVHVEDLAAQLAGQDRCDALARWSELIPEYRVMAESAGRS